MYRVRDQFHYQAQYLNNKKIKVLIFSFDEFSYGDCFIIDSEIHIPEKIEDFDYQKYLLIQNIMVFFIILKLNF